LASPPIVLMPSYKPLLPSIIAISLCC
jgi:hypothetical protein